MVISWPAHTVLNERGFSCLSQISAMKDPLSVIDQSQLSIICDVDKNSKLKIS